MVNSNLTRALRQKEWGTVFYAELVPEVFIIENPIKMVGFPPTLCPHQRPCFDNTTPPFLVLVILLGSLKCVGKGGPM
jgi:hypothetical protein